MATVTTNSERTGPEQGGWLAEARHNLDRALVITRREVLDMGRDWRILMPVIVLTLIFPSIANWGAGRMTAFVSDFGADLIGERLIPFLMMVVGFFPISFSLIIALETFVGEKERRSLEPLLSSPLTNLQLYIGKVLASTIPPVVGSLLGISVYLIGVYFNVGYRPPLVLLLQVVLLTLLQAFVMVAGAVVVSSQTTSVRAANLLASFIILPVAILIQAEALIMFWARYDVLWLVMFGLLIVSAVLVRMGIRTFNREELIGSEIDALNLGQNISFWWQTVLARSTEESRSPIQWYLQEVLKVVGKTWGAVVIIAIALGAAVLIGQRFAFEFLIPADVFQTEDWTTTFSALLAETGLEGLGGVGLIIWQNVRTLFLATLLAMFSLGIAIVLVIMVPIVLLTYLLVQILGAGLDPAIILAAVVPHTIFELPAAIIAAALALRLGASVVGNAENRTLAEGWIIAFADLTRVWALLVLPLLIIGAVVEIFLTPQLVLLLGGG